MPEPATRAGHLTKTMPNDKLNDNRQLPCQITLRVDVVISRLSFEGWLAARRKTSDGPFRPLSFSWRWRSPVPRGVAPLSMA